MSEPDWSDRIAWLAVDALVRSGIVSTADFDRAASIVEEEVRVRLCLGDYPPPDYGASGSISK
jgi:hypothetical protein